MELDAGGVDEERRRPELARDRRDSLPDRRVVGDVACDRHDRVRARAGSAGSRRRRRPRGPAPDRRRGARAPSRARCRSRRPSRSPPASPPEPTAVASGLSRTEVETFPVPIDTQGAGLTGWREPSHRASCADLTGSAPDPSEGETEMRRSQRTEGARRPRLLATATALAVLVALAVTCVGAGATRSSDPYTLKLKSGKTLLAREVDPRQDRGAQVDQLRLLVRILLDPGLLAAVPGRLRRLDPGREQDLSDQRQAALPAADPAGRQHADQPDPGAPEHEPGRLPLDRAAGEHEHGAHSSHSCWRRGSRSSPSASSTFGNELTNFTQVPEKEGDTAAATVVSYMKAHNLHFKTFAVSGGDPTQYWAAEPRQGLPAGDPDGDPGRDVRHDREEHAQHDVRPGQDVRRVQGVPVAASARTST